MSYAILKRQSRQNRIPNNLNINHGNLVFERNLIPPATAEECLPLGRLPLQGPSIAPICCPAIHRTLINKNQLIWIVGTNPSCKVCTEFSTPFKGYTSQLLNKVTKRYKWKIDKASIPFSSCIHSSEVLAKVLKLRHSFHAVRTTPAGVHQGRDRGNR
jgi:hypothetical protein